MPPNFDSQLVGACPLSVDRVAENVVIHVGRIACKGLLEPFMVGGCVVEDHVEHEADAAVSGLADQSVRVVHCAEHGIDAVIISYVVAVIIHRREEEWGDPQIVDPEILQIIKAAYDSAEIADTVAVRIAERFNINLINGAVSEIRHIGPPLEYISVGESVPHPDILYAGSRDTGNNILPC